MRRQFARLAAFAFTASLLGTAAACATRPDIVGHNDEAQEWAEQQKREPEDKTKDWPGARPAPAQPAK